MLSVAWIALFCSTLTVTLAMPSTHLRQTVMRDARRLVVKLGTQLLANPASEMAGIDSAYIHQIADQIAALIQRGYEITLVSSGAIGCGCVELGLTRRPTDVADLQAVAAVGQRRLMTHMHEAFARHGLCVAQLLLTRSDFDDRDRYLNFRNCIKRLHAFKAVPIVNENDTVSVNELRFGDNDQLAALTCNALRADMLILLTVVDGLLDEQGQVVDLVESIAEKSSLAHAVSSDWSRGGMSSKLTSARLVTDAGELAVIAGGRTERILLRLVEGEKLGTICLPATRKMDSRKRWIGLTARPLGTLSVNERAADAICRQGRSLLAVGITAVSGLFAHGDVVLVVDEQGTELARGLSNYGNTELSAIAGHHSTDFQAILGRPAYTEVIHRDNLVVLHPQV